MIYYITLIFIIMYGIIGKVNSTPRRKKIFIIIAFGLLTIISALRKYTVGIDMNLLYAPRYNLISSVGWNELWKINLESGYLIFCKILTYISNDVQLLIIVSSLIVIPAYGYFIYKNSSNVLISTILFLLLNSFFMSMNIVRQEIAIAILIFGYQFLIKNKNISFIISVILASLFHQSAILCVLLLPISKMKFTKKKFFISIVILILTIIFYDKIIEFVTNIISILGLNRNKDYTDYLTNEKYNSGSISLISISKYTLAFCTAILVYYYLVKLKKDKDKCNSFIVFGTIGYVIIVLLSSQMVIISRMEHYFVPFALVSIPNAISKSKYSTNKALIYSLLFLPLLARYIYVIEVMAGTLYGTTPYLFFWE